MHDIWRHCTGIPRPVFDDLPTVVRASNERVPTRCAAPSGADTPPFDRRKAFALAR